MTPLNYQQLVDLLRGITKSSLAGPSEPAVQLLLDAGVDPDAMELFTFAYLRNVVFKPGRLAGDTLTLDTVFALAVALSYEMFALGVAAGRRSSVTEVAA